MIEHRSRIGIDSSPTNNLGVHLLTPIVYGKETHSPINVA